MGGFAVVICGAGIAGVEALLRLRRMAGDAVQVTLLTPADDLVYRPSTLLEPFTKTPPSRYSIERIAADADARWIRDTLSWVDRTAQTVHTTGGQELRYDALLLAVGGRERKPDANVTTVTDHTPDHLYQSILDDLASGVIRSLVLTEPAGPSWPLPLYELALLTAKRADDIGVQPRIAVVTENPAPLESFGPEVGEVVTQLLFAAGISVYTRSQARVSGPHLVLLEPTGIELRPDRIVTLPTITGPNVHGIPGDAADRFLAVDAHCRIRDTGGRIFAAGDATDLRIKQGGLAAQQADTAAAGIAHLAGAAPSPAGLKPVMRGVLLTGGTPLYLTAYLIAGSGWRPEIHRRPPWNLEEAIVAEELGPYLAAF